MFDHGWNLEKANLSVRVLKRDVGFKISDVKSVEKLESVFTQVLRREGWEINDLSPLSWQFFWNFMTFGWFSKVESFETNFCFKKNLSQLWYHEMFVFSELCLSQKTFYCRNLIVFSCLQFADCYIWSRILSCGVIFVF